MATAVFFHAHPDDEAIATSGTMMLAKAAGHRIVLVLGTRGEQGEPVEGVLAEGERLGDRRTAETIASGDIIGADLVVFLDYEDSGMIDEPTNDNPACFWQADVEEAAQKLAALLTEESADVLTVYDSNGGYGHPDHIQVHRVGIRAAELAGVSRVFESTMNRTRILDQMNAMNEAMGGGEPGESDEDRAKREQEIAERREMMENGTFGLPEAELTHQIDVSSVIDRKKQSMMAHESQIDEESFFLQMPDEMFANAFGSEFYRDRSWVRGDDEFRTSLFAD